MDNAHAKSVQEVLAHFSVKHEKGLDSNQVAQQRQLHGRNQLPPEEGTSFWRLVLKQFDDLLVKILIVAALVDLILAIVDGEMGVKAVVEPGVIFLILLANATVGVVTETKAEKSIQALKEYEAETANVLRESQLVNIPASDLVPGDLVEISVGDKVPADIRIISVLSRCLKVDQSLLTGESGGVSKSERQVVPQSVAQDKTCVLFSGTMISSGRARGIVVATGTNTEIGKIRDEMMESMDEMTPLKKKLDEFGAFLSKVIAGICILVWVMNIGHFNDPIHGGMLKGAIYYFKIAVALAVAAIPEGLPAVVTTCLALGTQKMAKKNAIVRHLPSVETLGSTTVICSDKTGTLTTNMMSVSRVSLLNARSILEDYTVTGTVYSSEGHIVCEDGSVFSRPFESQPLVQIAMCSSLCNDSTLVLNSDTETYEGIGEPMEIALRVFAEKVGVPGQSPPGQHVSYAPVSGAAGPCNTHWKSDFQRIACGEFTSERKMMSVACEKDGRAFLFVKGAPEVVLKHCARAWVDSSGAIRLSEDLSASIQDKVDGWASTLALRSLALAYKPLDSVPKKEIPPQAENGLTFLGLMGMHDPPRPEVKDAINTCRAAGIRVVMVTGDAIGTATAVAVQTGLSNSYFGTSEGRVLTGLEFSNLSTADKESAAASIQILARVEPHHKSELVDILKSQGEVVAVTGDGVNDAPALKKANIGIAMGSGTAVARHASDMILADDNFSTIVTAVAEGRAIYNNTRQFIRYMVSSNIGEVAAIFLAASLGIPETLNPVQLLWVNLVTDGLPAIALGFNKPDQKIMKNGPRAAKDPVVGWWMFFRYLFVGLYVGVATVLGFICWYLYVEDGPKLSWQELKNFEKCVEGAQSYSCNIFHDPRSSTVAVSVLVMVEMFNALNALSENESLAHLPPWSNSLLMGAIAVSVALHCLILYIPSVSVLFSVTSLGWDEWVLILKLSFPVIILDEILKFVTRRKIGSSLSRSNSFWSRREHTHGSLGKSF